MAINYEAGTPVSHTEQFYDSLPSGEIVGQAAIAAGAGFAVGGVVGSAVALGYQFVLIPSADHAITQLFEKAESTLPSYINNSDTFKLGIKTAKTSLHFAVMGATASQGVVYGAFKAAAGIFTGNVAVNIAGKVQDDLEIKPDSIARRAINFMVGASWGYLGAEAAGRAMNSLSIGSATKDNHWSNRTLMCVDENGEAANEPLRVKRQTFCPVEEQTVISRRRVYDRTDSEYSSLTLVNINRVQAHNSSLAESTVFSSGTCSFVSYDRSMTNSTINMRYKSYVISYDDSLARSNVFASRFSNFFAIDRSAADSIVTISGNAVAKTYHDSVRDSVFTISGNGFVEATGKSMFNCTLNIHGGSVIFYESAGQKLKAFIGNGVLVVGSNQALKNGTITVCNKGRLLNSEGTEILNDDERHFTLSTCLKVS